MGACVELSGGVRLAVRLAGCGLMARGALPDPIFLRVVKISALLKPKWAEVTFGIFVL